jgi:hypothetical protein
MSEINNFPGEFNTPAPRKGKLTVEVLDFRPVERNTLLGFATVRIPAMRLTIRDVAIHTSGDRRWVSLPAKPQLDADGVAIRKDGKIQYVNIFHFDTKEVSDAFSAAVIRAAEALPIFSN